MSFAAEFGYALLVCVFAVTALVIIIEIAKARHAAGVARSRANHPAGKGLTRG